MPAKAWRHIPTSARPCFLVSERKMRFESFEQFWPYYVREHSRKATRLLHFMGTGAAIAALAAGVLTRRGGLIALAPVLGYGPAWIGHFFVQRNKPATF